MSSRVEERQAVFDTWPAEVQTDVRNGIVRIGYNSQMAYVAYGPPDQRIRSEEAAKVVVVWVYQAQVPVARASPYGWFEVGVGHHHHGAGYGLHYGPGYGYETRDYLRLYFESDRIVKIERLE
ncbi:MAG: hypothetical protein K0U93_10460 [Gammaproteobacteria bacterium]|nr:hypothetical protein [Gammaproteobacteria bacterium]